MKKKLLIVLACLLAIAGVLCGIYLPNSEINNTIDTVQNIITEEIQKENNIVITDEIQESVNETKEATQSGQDISTTQLPESTEDEEIEVTDEGATEIDAVVEQENISYNGDNSGAGLSLLGKYQGLTYYSQADSRWANAMYSSVGDRSQTMKSSACGPTSAAMIVSSSKGAILPTTMASLFVENGYRTSNNGTAWAAFPFIADYFDFEEYYTTSYFDTAMNYLSQKENNGNSKYYIIVSCGSGLFTSGGHYIVLTSLDGETIQVYDPYLYNGKFQTASRRNAGVVVSGNSAFVSKSSFKQYANYKNFWIFSNDSKNSVSTNIGNQTQSVTYTRYVATQSSNLNVRTGPGMNYNVTTSIAKGTAVNVIEVNGSWSKISYPNGWVSSSYLSSSVVKNENNTIGQYYKLKGRTLLYANSSMKGTYYTYLPNTKIKIIKNISSNIDYIYVPKTNRYAYCYNSAYSSNSVQNNKNYSNDSTVGQYYKLKGRTLLYANSNMRGTYYTYLPNTKIKIIKNISSNIDYIYVPKTNRYAYCYKSAYK